MQKPLTHYSVTLTDPDDPSDTRTLDMSENEIIDTYPHWNYSPGTLTDRDGFIVTIAAAPAN